MRAERPAEFHNHHTDTLGLYNPAQAVELERIRLTQYDRMNGPRVFLDLLQNRQLWTAAKLVSYVHDHQRESLRALEVGSTHDDTLLLSTTRPHREALQRLAEGWKADAVDWDKGEETPDGPLDDPNFQVLSVTWWQDGFGANHENGKHALKFDLPGGRG